MARLGVGDSSMRLGFSFCGDRVDGMVDMHKMVDDLALHSELALVRKDFALVFVRLHTH